MFRVVQNSEAIYAMSHPKKIVLSRLCDLTEQINKHVIKCVVYQYATTTDPEHWVHEIAAWINKANCYKCKSKLTEQDYEDTLFGAFGDELYDAKINLLEFRDKNVKYRSIGQYPDFEITDELVAKLFETYQQILAISIPQLISGEVISTKAWEAKLVSILL